MTPEDIARTKNMLSDLNEMVPTHDDDEPYDFQNFMDQYGDLFPENPQNLEELLQSLAQRMAQAQAMMNSMSPDQRQRLQDLIGALRGPRPHAPDEGARQRLPPGDARRDVVPAVSVRRRRVARDERSHAGHRAHAGVGAPREVPPRRPSRPTSARSTSSGSRTCSAKRPRRTSTVCARSRRCSRRPGTSSAPRVDFDLTPQGVRRIGKQALGKVYHRLRSALAGEHDQPDIGRGGDITGDLRHYEFGDSFHIEVKETVFEAVRGKGLGRR